MDFTHSCYALARQVPRGKVTTYKAIAEALGTRAYRAVGTAMRTNPEIPATPCHRVIASSGHIGGYVGGIQRKKELLLAEGVCVDNKNMIDLDTYLFTSFLRFKNRLNSS